MAAREGEVHVCRSGWATRADVPSPDRREKRPILHAATSSGPPPGNVPATSAAPAAAATTTNYKFRMKT